MEESGDDDLHRGSFDESSGEERSPSDNNYINPSRTQLQPVRTATNNAKTQANRILKSDKKLKDIVPRTKTKKVKDKVVKNSIKRYSPESKEESKDKRGLEESKSESKSNSNSNSKSENSNSKQENDNKFDSIHDDIETTPKHSKSEKDNIVDKADLPMKNKFESIHTDIETTSKQRIQKNEKSEKTITATAHQKDLTHSYILSELEQAKQKVRDLERIKYEKDIEEKKKEEKLKFEKAKMKYEDDLDEIQDKLNRRLGRKVRERVVVVKNDVGGNNVNAISKVQL